MIHLCERKCSTSWLNSDHNILIHFIHFNQVLTKSVLLQYFTSDECQNMLLMTTSQSSLPNKLLLFEFTNSVAKYTHHIYTNLQQQSTSPFPHTTANHIYTFYEVLKSHITPQIATSHGNVLQSQ